MLCYDCCVDRMYVVSDLGEWNDDNDDVIGQDETRQGAVSILFNVIELLFFFFAIRSSARQLIAASHFKRCMVGDDRTISQTRKIRRSR
jgi:hypothetical protein